LGRAGGARVNPPYELGPDLGGRVLLSAGERVLWFGRGSRPAGPPGPEEFGDLPPASYPAGGPDFSAPVALDCAGARIVPGLVNAHTHLYSALAPLGMPPPEPPPEDFLQILERVWWRLDRGLDEASLRVSARLYAAESLLAGTTTVVDHHESPNLIEGSLDVLADACEEIGVRAVLCYGATERNGGRDEARRGLAECRRFIRGNRRQTVRGVVGLHASFTVSDETIREAGDLCRELDTVMHVHLAEDAADIRDARDRGYEGPLERLLALDALPPGSILAHGVHLNEEQVRRAADLGLWLVQNPRSNLGNRVGYPRGLTASRRVALGTDGYHSVMDAEVEAFAPGGAGYGTSEGEPPEVLRGRLETGWALIAERFGLTFAPLGADTAADAVVFEEADPGDARVESESGVASGARHVLVGGRLVVRDGRLATADLSAIRAEASAEAPKLWERLR
jgi:cytosine/adenosine deaminase-related metal-dependent hydrolase